MKFGVSIFSDKIVSDFDGNVHFSRFLTIFWRERCLHLSWCNPNLGSALEQYLQNIFFALPSALKIASVFMQLLLAPLCILKI